MAHALQQVSLLSSEPKLDPTKYDITISALLIGLGAEKYIDIFRKQNIGQCTLAELSDEDLKKIGVDDPEVRQKLLEEVKNLPLYDESTEQSKTVANIGPMEIVDVMEETSQHLYRIYLSMLANNLALKKTKNISDCLLYKDKYASDVALATLNEISATLDSIDMAMRRHLKTFKKDSKSRKNKKIIIGSLGSAAIVMIGMLFIKSLKQIN